MTSRIVAIVLGAIAGLAALAFLSQGWDRALAFARVGPAVAARLSTPEARFAWTVSVTASAFAVAAFAVAVVGGLAETLAILRRIDALRHDPALAGRWNAADWRSVFAQTTVSDRAEAMIAAAPPMHDGEERRVVVDAPLLFGLRRIWLDRLTLAWSMAPLPPLLLGMGAAFALISTVNGGDWAGPLAAGFAGWFAISAARYAASVILMPFVARAVAVATAAIRPLTLVQSLDSVHAPSVPAQPTSLDAELIAEALADALTAPLQRLADAADRLAVAAPSSREEGIDTALAEIRAGIERLLAASNRR